MKLNSVAQAFCGAFLASTMVFVFQNCGPANLQSSASTVNYANQVGTTVDLTTLNAAAAEASENVLYPSNISGTTYAYSQDAPIIQNVVLLNNDFTYIEWVYVPTATVVAVSDTYSGVTNYSENAAGQYDVVGYRGSTPYMIAQITLVDQISGNSVAANSNGAVQIEESTVSSNGQNESILLQVLSPSVSLSSIEFIADQTDQSYSGVRALLVTKPLSETLVMSVSLTDTDGNLFQSAVNLPITEGSSPPTVPTPISTPVPTPTPIPDLCSMTSENNTSNLSCPDGQVITQVVFASFGDPAVGACGNYSPGTCNDPNSVNVAQQDCLGQQTCAIDAVVGDFADDCVGEPKTLTLDVICGPAN